MVTMSNFGKNGRLGNQLFQWAFLSSLARKVKVEYWLPEWEYKDYFIEPPRQGVCSGEKITERQYGYSDYSDLDFTKDLDFSGHFQNEKYFDEQVKNIQFRQEFKDQVKENYLQLFSRPTIAIGVRRSDYLTLPYYQLPIAYYITALFENFPEWRNYNLIFITDDIPYSKTHFQCLENAYFPEVKDIEAICLMSQCDHFIIPNSTFHWWAAFIGEKDYSIIIQPNHLFAGKLLEKFGDINFYSDRWAKFEHEGKKINLTDVTFTIPVFYDHKDRQENIELVVCLLQKHFDTNIIIGEQGGNKFQHMEQFCKYVNFDYKDFHRTKMLNEMAKISDTPIIANWDADVWCPPMQIFECVERLRKGAEMCYPYGWNFIRIPRKTMKEIIPSYDVGVFSKYNFPNNDAPGQPSFGGAVMWNKQTFFEIGQENEYMISFAPEDVERIERATKLGVRIERVNGELYHFNHYCGPDSSITNPHFKKNRAQLHKQREMNKDELMDYINSWPWHEPYTAGYYETITEDAVRSRDEVFRILGIDNNCFIIDCGCGLGQWGVGLANYVGIDFNIPVEKLLTLNGVKNYQEWDLRIPGLMIARKADVVLCLEVAEHLEEKYADILIDNICKLGDTIIFSAAIPGQGGNNHLNEQWQTYWAKKFYERGYGGYQVKAIRENKNICLWYRQNLCIYKKGITKEVEDYVLPEYYDQIIKYLKSI